MGEPRERPILMSGPMIRAIFEGRKSQTRRVVKPQPHPNHVLSPAWGTSPDGFEFGEKHLWIENGPDYPDGPEDERRCPFGVPGDRLWVRETFALSRRDPLSFDDEDTKDPSQWDAPVYHADGETGAWEHYDGDGTRTAIPPPWRPSIHMPRWASRITLRVTSVGVERVQDISEEDARAEGVHEYAKGRGIATITSRSVVFGGTPRDVFGVLWDSINGKRAGCAWRDNPWVWAVGFEVERRV